MSLTPQQISDEIMRGLTDESYKKPVREKRAAYMAASPGVRLEIRKNDPENKELYDIFDELEAKAKAAVKKQNQ